MRNINFIKGHSLMFVSTLFFSMNFIVLKYLMPRWFDGFDATMFRICGGATLFWITSLFIRNKSIDKEDRLMVFLSGILGLLPFIVFFNLAIQYSSPIDVSIIMTTPPMLVVIASAFIYKTKISLVNALGLFLSLAGAIFLILIGGSMKGTARSMTGNIFAAISSVAYAFYILSLKKSSSKYNEVTLLRWVFLSASLGALPIGLVFIKNAHILHHPDATAILLLAFVIIFPSFLSFLLMPPAIRLIGQQLVSMYQNVIPVLATTFAVILKMDKLYWDQPVAIAVILLGVFISSKAVKKEKSSL